MKITIDTEADTLEDLQNALSIVVNSIEKKGGKIIMQQSQQNNNLQEVQQTPPRKPNMENAYVKRFVEQEKLMEQLDISNILQSDFGLQRRREDILRKKNI
ncbi:hypothetical protein HYX17_01080 [Candidatus Woesearchaeota archaeon]|nr:hypothetical protein [Candidatus Woesearchaeota archaeon]